TSATVGGTVNPNGQATTWFVQYGKTTGYGSQTGTLNAGAGTTSTNVSTTLNGLSPGTTCHYRIVATNATGTTQGADAVLTTSGAPAPDAVTGAAGGISSTGASLTGSVNPNGRPTTWFFEYGTSTGYGSRTPSQNGGAGTGAFNVSAQVSGLQAGRTYHFRLVATSDGGTSHGSDQSFTAGSAPSVQTTAANSVSTTGARLNGRVNPNGLNTAWHFDYGTSENYGASTPSHGARSAGSPRPPRGPDLPLPPRRVELLGHDRRRRPDLHDRRDAGGGDRIGRCRRDHGHPERHGRPARPHDDVVLRVRHDDGLRRAH